MLIIQKIFFFILLFYILLPCVIYSKDDTIVDKNGYIIKRELLSLNRDNNKKKIEIFWTKPDGNGPYPAILFIHGHQEQVRNGGKEFVRLGRLGKLARRGFVAASVSQPGYGNSDGPPDYCGPYTQEAVLVAIEFLRKQAFVKPDKISICGFSRGAITASMVATKDKMLAGLILVAGAYDFFKWYKTTLYGIKNNILIEAGTSDKAFIDRSSFYHAEKINVPILLVHGSNDDRIPVQQAKDFAEKLKANDVKLKLIIFPNAGHSVPLDELYREIYSFLDEYLR